MTRPFELLGHRGARGLFAENTLEGFRATRALGVIAFELDVAMTKDDVVVVSHDPALNPDITRTADGTWLAGRGPLIRSLTLAQLADYDVGRIMPGSRYAALYPEQVPLDGARIPTLTEVLQSDQTARFTVELKVLADHPDWTVDGTVMAEAVVAVADAIGATSRIAVQSFDWRGPRHLRRIRPDVRSAWLTRAETVANAPLWWDLPDPSAYNSVPQAVANEGGPVWSPEHADLTETLLDEAHDLGLAVIPWTVNQPADLHRLIGWGVDGIITDRPDLARQALASRGLGVAPIMRG